MKVIVWVLQDTAAARLTVASWTRDSDSNYVKSFKIYLSQSKQKPRIIRKDGVALRYVFLCNPLFDSSVQQIRWNSNPLLTY